MFEEYLENNKIFRKRIRKCLNMMEIYNLLKDISEEDSTYKIFFKFGKYGHRYFDDFAIFNHEIVGYFEGEYKRTYKTIKNFSYQVYLSKSIERRGFTVDYNGQL